MISIEGMPAFISPYLAWSFIGTHMPMKLFVPDGLHEYISNSVIDSSIRIFFKMYKNITKAILIDFLEPFVFLFFVYSLGLHTLLLTCFWNARVFKPKRTGKVKQLWL